MSERIAFIGLGVMGFPMAGHLADAGFDVTVFNRSADKTDRWMQKHEGKRAVSAAAAAATCDIIFSCVGNDDDVREILLSENGALAGASDGALIVDHTTASADVARELGARAKTLHVGFLDAPVSGGQAGAENGQLTIMVGGSEAHFRRAKPVMDSYAKAMTRIGDVGSGQLAKMVNQICIAGVVQGLSEGLHFAKCAGLDVPAVIDSISKGAAQSWQMENRWETMIEGEFDFGFAVDWMRKDLAIALAEADANGATLDLARLVDGYYAEVQDLGGQRWDTSSLIARLDR